MLDLSQSSLTSNDNSYVKGKLDSSKLYAYQEQLSSKQLQKIESIQALLLEKLGYSLISKEKINPKQLSVYQRIRINQIDNIKQLFRSRQDRMENWQTKKVKIPLNKRIYSFLLNWSRDFLSKPLVDQFFRRKRRKSDKGIHHIIKK